MESFQHCALAIVERSNPTAIYNCQWSPGSTSADFKSACPTTLDVLINLSDSYEPPPDNIPEAQPDSNRRLFVYTAGDSDPIPVAQPAHDFLLQHLHAHLLGDSTKGFLLAIKFVLPYTDGYIVRSDFLERRLQGFELAAEVVGFVSPRQEIKSSHNKNSLAAQLATSIGAIVLKAGQGLSLQNVFSLTEAELDNRIAFSWISHLPIPEKRLIWVEGRKDFELSRQMYEAAWALGITLVVLDNPGHWLEDNQSSYAYLREAFVPLDIQADEGLPNRIIDAVKSYSKPIDGIMSVSDARVIAVAQACEALGFSTSPSKAYISAADKYETRMLELDQRGVFQVHSVAELEDCLHQGDHPPLDYPLIVKPCIGWNSECISKVSSKPELIEAVQKASARHAKSPQRRTDVMIEPYIEGVEVDANFVLFNKELLFFEVADDFPSPGDASNASWNDGFQETTVLLPTGLPEDEILIIRDSIHQSILRQGFSTGVFHCEGRVRYSSMHYSVENGVEDLYPNYSELTIQRKSSFYLHEINARPAGYLESVATHLTYGVDYFAQQLLFAIGDEPRYRTLAAPFTFGPQWHLALLIIPEEREGVMMSEDAGRELLDRLPELEAAIPDYKTVQKKGDVLLGSRASELSYLAYFSVVSRDGRRDTLQLAQKIRKEFQYKLE